jgi:hypothetical protein
MQYPELKELKDALGLDKDSQVLFINTEGNTDPSTSARSSGRVPIRYPSSTGSHINPSQETTEPSHCDGSLIIRATDQSSS